MWKMWSIFCKRVSWSHTFGNQTKVAAHWPGVSLLLALFSVRNVINNLKKGTSKDILSEQIWKTRKSVSALTGCSHTPHSHRRLGLAQISTDTRAPARLLSTDRHSQSSCHNPASNQEKQDAVSTLQLGPGSTPAFIPHPKQDLLFLTETVPANTLLLPKLLHT